MTKSDLFVALAQIPDNDARLQTFADVLAGRTAQPARSGSFRLYRMSEAAKVIGLSRSTVWRAVKDGRIKTVEVRSGLLRIPENELRRLVEGPAAESAPADGVTVWSPRG